MIRHLPEHLLRDQREVVTRHFEVASKTALTPAPGIADERELVHQRTDRCSLSFRKSMSRRNGAKRGAISNTYTLSPDYLANGGELLTQRFAIKAGFWW